MYLRCLKIYTQTRESNRIWLSIEKKKFTAAETKRSGGKKKKEHYCVDKTAISRKAVDEFAIIDEK